MGSMGDNDDLDVIIVGAGFSGIFALHRLRKLGLRAKIFEAGDDIGGVWYWNRYPGARVDSEWPFYQLSIPEVWKDFDFSERFPDHREIRSYFAHAVDVLGLRNDIVCGARVNSTRWSPEAGNWTIQTEAGHKATGKYIFLCTGLLHRLHQPDFDGVAEYKGEIHHSSAWPREGLDVTGKKVCIIGTGATGVQLVQELAKQASQLTILMRRPSLCLPIGQRQLTATENAQWKTMFPALFRQGRQSAGGLPLTPPKRSIYDLTDKELEEYYESLWKAGSFSFGGANFPQIFMDLKANRMAYDFWAKKTRQRMKDPVKRELMAPREPPYPLLTKRCPLEVDYYEMLDRSNVDILDLNATPVKRFTDEGIEFEGGSRQSYDYVVMATGYESFTGSLANLGLHDKHGRDIRDIWAKDGIKTYLGMCIAGFPNLFMSYSSHAPTVLSNGPTILECQVDYVVDAIEKLERERKAVIEPTEMAQKKWCDDITEMFNMTLYPMTSSWWNAANIPGRPPQSLTYVGGIEQYEKDCRQTLAEWEGFDVR